MRYWKLDGTGKGIKVDVEAGGDQLPDWDDGQVHERKPDVVILKSSHLDRWHSESVNPHSWYKLPLGSKPIPIVVFKNEAGQPCGIVHMRNMNGQRSVSISLLNQKGAWQTGVWLEIGPGDKLAISWFRDWRKTEISAINLEIISAEHEEPATEQDDLIPLGDEIDLEMFAAEAALLSASPDAAIRDDTEADFDSGFASGGETQTRSGPELNDEPAPMAIDPGASIIICTTSPQQSQAHVDTAPWFEFRVSAEPLPVANLITDHQRLAGKIYLRRYADEYQVSLAAVLGNDEYPSGAWKTIIPGAPLTLAWATDPSGELLEEFHIEFD